VNSGLPTASRKFYWGFLSMNKMTQTIFQFSAALGLLLLSSLSHAQPKSTEALLLGSPYGEFCTMCEAFVVCLPESDVNAPQKITALPTSENFTLYYFPTRTFWQQIYTIWEWFSMMFVPMNTHDRPLEIYQPDANGSLTHTLAGTGFSVDPPQITVPDGIIQRDNGKWLNANNQAKGQCYRLPLWETLDAVAKRLPQKQNTDEGKNHE
jgi:hypothetical protein